ncbi:alpha/beta hydrolase [Pseudomonas sp. LTJR-52]|uniref:alpha/beta hydrolase n=1 Tax=Pseudomonas sp. LTJR-52 TaxID=2479392 RepID=UPI000EFC2530|nr:alpha/beta hydrolase [Pseudomonas sp. LTJR-52]AYN96980.1 alpha/beta hydrolase [Pseudomonas sp. LTJR-52]
MSQLELQQLLMAAKDQAPDLSDEPHEIRRKFDAMLEPLPYDSRLNLSSRAIGSIEGLWVDAPHLNSGRILLYLHGGAYVFGGSTSYRSLGAALANTCQAPCFIPDYRLAPEHPYPAAVNDVLTVYQDLLNQGYEASHISLIGDSAGGGLSLALLVSAREKGLPLPGNVVLLSPWADLAMTGESLTRQAERDPLLTEAGLRKSSLLYLKDLPPDTPLASPLYSDLTGLPPMLIQVGSREILLSDAVRIAERAGLVDVSVELSIWPGMVHVWQLFSAHLSEARLALNAIGRFVLSQQK